MNSRRKFLKTTGILSSALLLNPIDFLAKELPENEGQTVNKPIVLSTWDFGLKANEEAWKILEKGVRLVENDPSERSVGYGGRPDRD